MPTITRWVDPDTLQVFTARLSSEFPRWTSTSLCWWFRGWSGFWCRICTLIFIVPTRLRNSCITWTKIFSDDTKWSLLDWTPRSHCTLVCAILSRTCTMRSCTNSACTCHGLHCIVLQLASVSWPAYVFRTVVICLTAFPVLTLALCVAAFPSLVPLRTALHASSNCEADWCRRFLSWRTGCSHANTSKWTGHCREQGACGSALVPPREPANQRPSRCLRGNTACATRRPRSMSAACSDGDFWTHESPLREPEVECREEKGLREGERNVSVSQPSTPPFWTPAEQRTGTLTIHDRCVGFWAQANKWCLAIHCRMSRWSFGLPDSSLDSEFRRFVVTW